jgi:hypothetical protein
MKRWLALLALVAGLAAATSPVWALGAGNPSFVPDPAYPGQSVSFAGSLPDVGFDPSPCEVTASDAPSLAYSCAYDNTGTFSGWVVIPSTVSPGAPYTMFFCGPTNECAVGKGLWHATNAVSVIASPVPSVTVPTLHCSTLRPVYKSVVTGGLRLAPTSFPGPIGHVVPPGGSLVPRGSTITPYPARVPGLRGLTYPAAVARVESQCGIPTPAGPTDGVVVGQEPLPGIAMPTDRLVTVSLSPTVVTPRPHPHPQPIPPGPPHHPWWWRVTHHRAFMTWTGGSMGFALAAVIGVHQWRHRRPHVRQVTVVPLLVWEPHDPARPRPSLIVRTTPPRYRLEDSP